MDEHTWHLWRNKGIGSSDAPVIMGVSPYATPYELWEFKTLRKLRWEGNWATRRGTAMEPRARADYEFTMDCEMPATLMTHSHFPWLRASLDGYNRDLDRVLEIKCPGAKDHALALAGEVPEKYYPQLQHQLLVSGARVNHYWSFDGHEGALIEVALDPEYIRVYFERALAFWQCMESDEAPPLVQRDWKLRRDKNLRLALEELGEGGSDYIIERFNLKDRRVRCAGFLVDGFKGTIEQQIPR